MPLVLGCMRLVDTPHGDEARSPVLEAALRAGVRAFDTARAYASDDGDLGANERLLARAIADSGVDRRDVRILTKCGMRRPGGRWVPDGRRRTILEDAEASARDLGGPADLLLLHAIDPNVPLATSVRALRDAQESGFARAIGLSNVRRAALTEALEIAPISAIEISLGAFDDGAARGGLAQHALGVGVEVLTYGLFGGPTHAKRLRRDRELAAIATARGLSPHRAFLAFVEALEPRLSS